jgi:alkanesulfonate monooxygenase SsuD/methylene tetrahydromethanopterin reductase-like flavin-dependent oxidoreductase (luciferase family)
VLPTVEAARAQFQLDLDDAEIRELPALLIGSPAEIATQLRDRRERYGISYFVVIEPSFEAFAPVIELLTE